ncbi:hypothetical protein PI124_g24074 [Phytophthora idaei]|nr:hypothetical protein PI125_g26419 [Phytophthora idaei]KAG3122443.1 hypothetical protein PI126_g24148 [Phytophthora idaei]KAG3230829.1 hypothetical protein PI124_g24074 [Phytophthora idaei]
MVLKLLGSVSERGHSGMSPSNEPAAQGQGTGNGAEPRCTDGRSTTEESSEDVIVTHCVSEPHEETRSVPKQRHHVGAEVWVTHMIAQSSEVRRDVDPKAFIKTADWPDCDDYVIDGGRRHWCRALIGCEVEMRRRNVQHDEQHQSPALEAISALMTNRKIVGRCGSTRNCSRFSLAHHVSAWF